MVQARLDRGPYPSSTADTSFPVMNPNPPPAWFGYVFPAAFAAFWCLISWLISFVGGWSRLANRYRCREAVVGTEWRFQSAEMRRFAPGNYGSCLRILANQDGIGFSVLFPFRIGHPPLFFPWSEIMVEQKTVLFFFKRVRFTFPLEPTVSIVVSDRLAEKIQRAIGQNWFDESPKNGGEETAHRP